MPKPPARGKTNKKRSTKKGAKTSRAAAVVEQPFVPQPLSNVWQLTKHVANMLWQYRRLFLGIVIVYGLLNLILVRGFSSTTNITDLRNQLHSLFTGNIGALGSSLGVFVFLVGSAGNGSSDTAGAYQFFLAVISSLAVIWALRQVLSGATPRARDAYYQGMGPLIPFMLVLLFIGLLFIPMLIGSTVYAAVLANGIAVGIVEKILWAVFFVVLSAITIYLLNSLLVALYIVTLPDMTPLKALRSARDLTRGRRWIVLRKLLWLPFFLLITTAIIMVPIIIIAAPVAQWVFFVLTMFSLLAIHGYLYSLYRELLNG